MADADDQNLDELKRRGRRRLIGAVVLALVAAVVVPMLLESDPKPLGEDVSVRIPPVDDGKFQNKLGSPPPRKSLADAEKSVLAPGGRPPAPAEAKAPPQPVPAPAGDAAPATPAPAVAAKATPPEPPAPAAPKSAEPSPPPATPAKADAPKSGAFVVQLAAFSDDKGANALANKLKRGGYPAFTETLTTARGTLWRVRVGPYPTRDAAGQSRDRLKGDGHAGIVVPAK